MTIRTLFSIILKVIGLFFIRDILETLAKLASVLWYWSKGDTFDDSFDISIWWTFVTSFIFAFAYGMVAWFLIFRSESIIDKLKLDKGFGQDEIALNMHRSSILRISIVVIGGLIIADEIPNLCNQIWAYFRERKMLAGQSDPFSTYTVLAGTKIVIGVLLISSQRQIVNFIERKRRR